MLRVVSVVDKVGTALDRLAKGVIPYHKNLDYHVVDVHPKRPSPEQLERLEQLARTADVMDYQYYRTADMLRQRYPWLKEIPSILTHNNPYAIKQRDWNDYQVNVGNNRTIFKDLQDITATRVEYISLAADPYFWKFNDDYKFNWSVIMVANRIEAKKGILTVAKACKQINAKLYLVGAISDPNYFQEIIATGAVEFAQEVSDEELRDLYHKAGVHVCNSVDNFESGTLPIVEAALCGVPIITRKVGHVPDFYTEAAFTLNTSVSEDVEHLTILLNELLADRKRLEDMRHEAWLAVKHLNFERRAYAYQKLYRELLDGLPVTVIMPIADKDNITRNSLNAIANQTHKNIEVIVADDGEESQQEMVEDFAKTVSIPVRYIRLGGEGYHLAEARNRAIIEATSDVLVFCDQRMIMEPNAVEEFLTHLKPKHWLYGSKGVKKDFVENFSCIYRDEIVTMGMFNERITQYGGMSQECRSRARRQGIVTEYVESARAVASGKSMNRKYRKYEMLASKNLLWKVGLQ